MKFKPLLLTLAIAAVPCVAGADGASTMNLSKMMNPGLWETTVQMQMAGMPMKIPAHSYKRCVTQADLDKNRGVPKPQNTEDMNCTMSNFNVSGNTVNYTMKCTGKEGNMQMDGSATFDSRDAYHGTMHMTGTAEGHPMDVTSNIQAKRVGDCTGN